MYLKVTYLNPLSLRLQPLFPSGGLTLCLAVTHSGGTLVLLTPLLSSVSQRLVGGPPGQAPSDMAWASGATAALEGPPFQTRGLAWLPLSLDPTQGPSPIPASPCPGARLRALPSPRPSGITPSSRLLAWEGPGP